jgi:hypothetical protein
VNFVFEVDEHKHICEVQLIHEKMLLVRKDMGGHASYAHLRAAGEMVEMLLPRREAHVLADLFASAGGENWKHKYDWCSGMPLAAWAGVTVNKADRLVGLTLQGNNLRGERIWMIALVLNAKMIRMTLLGAIPASILHLTRLESLDLSYNHLTGAFVFSTLLVRFCFQHSPLSHIWLLCRGGGGRADS